MTHAVLDIFLAALYMAGLILIICLCCDVRRDLKGRMGCTRTEEVKQKDFQVWFDVRVSEMDRAFGVKRSSHWPKARAAHIAKFPTCAVCAGHENLEVHHVEPFHVNPERELDPTNFITLCEAPGHNCHFLFGHFLSWRCFNPAVRTDATVWNGRIHDRKEGVPSS